MYVYFFGNNYNIGELTLKSCFKRKNDYKHYFCGVLHPLINESWYASKLRIRQSLSRYTAFQTEKSMKSKKNTSSCHYGNTDNLLVTVRTPMITEPQWKGEQAIMLCFQWCLTFYKMFQAKDSVRNTSAITAVTNSSMKSWCSTTANRHLRSSGQRSAEQRRTKVSFSRTMMQALELLQLAKRHILGQSDEDQWKDQAYSLSHFWVMLVWRHYISQLVENSLR